MTAKILETQEILNFFNELRFHVDQKLNYAKN